jgi:hypothetical protein
MLIATANTLTYGDTATFTVAKSFMVQAPTVNLRNKLWSNESYNIFEAKKKYLHL